VRLHQCLIPPIHLARALERLARPFSSCLALHASAEGFGLRGSGIAPVSAALAATDFGLRLADRLRARLFALSLEGA
jgi:hypothetical protein